MDNSQDYYNLSRAVCVKIRNLCMANGIRLIDIADRLGVSESTVNRHIGPKVIYENDINDDWKPPSLPFIIGAADVLGIDPVDLFPSAPNGDSLRAVMWRFKRRLTAEENDPAKELKFFLSSLADNL